MAEKSRKNGKNPELALATNRVHTIEVEMAEAMKQRASLPKSASDEEKSAAATHVEGLQAQLHEAKQQVLSIKREESATLERDHKEKKQRIKRLKALHEGGGHEAPHEEPPAPFRRPAVRRPMDRAAEEAALDVANAHDMFLERQRLESENKASAEEGAVLRRAADKKRRKDETAERRETAKRQKAEARAKAEAERLAEEKKERAGIRHQAALERSQEAKAKKRQQRAEREAREETAQADRQSGWFSGAFRMLKELFVGRQ